MTLCLICGAEVAEAELINKVGVGSSPQYLLSVLCNLISVPVEEIHSRTLKDASFCYKCVNQLIDAHSLFLKIATIRLKFRAIGIEIQNNLKRQVMSQIGKVQNQNSESLTLTHRRLQLLKKLSEAALRTDNLGMQPSSDIPHPESANSDFETESMPPDPLSNNEYELNQFIASRLKEMCGSDPTGTDGNMNVMKHEINEEGSSFQEFIIPDPVQGELGNEPRLATIDGVIIKEEVNSSYDTFDGTEHEAGGLEQSVEDPVRQYQQEVRTIVGDFLKKKINFDSAISSNRTEPEPSVSDRSSENFHSSGSMDMPSRPLPSLEFVDLPSNVPSNPNLIKAGFEVRSTVQKFICPALSSSSANKGAPNSCSSESDFNSVRSRAVCKNLRSSSISVKSVMKQLDMTEPKRAKIGKNVRKEKLNIVYLVD